MFTRNTALATALLILLPCMAFAHPSADILEIQVALNKDVKSGMTIDEAVTHRIGHRPADASKIVATALDLLNRLPSRACIDHTAKDTQRPLYTDYEACSYRIIKAAILAGADPAIVATASAAGDQASNNQPQQQVKALYLRRLFLLGSS